MDVGIDKVSLSLREKKKKLPKISCLTVIGVPVSLLPEVHLANFIIVIWNLIGFKLWKITQEMLIALLRFHKSQKEETSDQRCIYACKWFTTWCAHNLLILQALEGAFDATYNWLQIYRGMVSHWEVESQCIRTTCHLMGLKNLVESFKTSISE